MKITVYGQARPQGSPMARFNPKTGQAFVTEDTRGNRGYKSWRQEVTLAMMADAPASPHNCALGVKLTVYVARPKAHYGAGKNAAVLKESAPEIPANGIDLDKLARSCGDAGKGVWWVDDSRIAYWEIRREYSETGQERIDLEAVVL